jgi:RimJ/RimL family protein N-acetyltransferase
MTISPDRLTLRRATAAEVAELPAGAAQLVVTDGHDILGGVGLAEVRPHTAALSFWTAPQVRRRGVATYAVRTLAAQSRERLELIVDVANIAAQRVALNAGFSWEGVLRGGRLHRDEVLWAWLPGDPAGPAARALPDLLGGELTDGVVTLRPLGPDDADDLVRLMSTPDVYARSVPPEPRPPADLVRRCHGAASNWLAGHRADFAVRVDRAYAGDLGLYNQPQLGEAMIGYSLLPEWRGRGLATRAVRLISRWAFDVGIARLIAGTAPDNTGSQRVLEKAGFTRESLQRSRLPGANGTRTDDVLWAMLPGELRD